MSKTYFNQNYNTVNTQSIQVEKKSENLNVVSLFSGAGGMDLGFKGGFEYVNNCR